MDELTIAKLLAGNLPRLKHNEKAIEEWEAANPFTPQIPLVEKATYVGVEIEAENIVRRVRMTSLYWEDKQDGSLRNNGREFITVPIKVSRLEQALTHLFYDMERVAIKPDFSPRTSIHVHMNVRTLNLQQLETLILTYMVVEKVLFKWVGNERIDNIFCIPLYNIDVSASLPRAMQNIHELRWSKYTALNLAPILDRGTVEFRHLHGTKSVARIMMWVNFMLCLKKFALKNDPAYVKSHILTLNSNSQYYLFLKEVFGDLAEELLYANFEKDIGYCVSNIKTQYIYSSNYPKFLHVKLAKFYNETQKKIFDELQQLDGMPVPQPAPRPARRVRINPEATHLVGLDEGTLTQREAITLRNFINTVAPRGT